MKSLIVGPSTHTWRSAGWKLAACIGCKKQTTGRVKDINDKREKALCSDCARVKGF